MSVPLSLSLLLGVSCWHAGGRGDLWGHGTHCCGTHCCCRGDLWGQGTRCSCRRRRTYRHTPCRGHLRCDNSGAGSGNQPSGCRYTRFVNPQNTHARATLPTNSPGRIGGIRTPPWTPHHHDDACRPRFDLGDDLSVWTSVCRPCFWSLMLHDTLYLSSYIPPHTHTHTGVPW